MKRVTQFSGITPWNWEWYYQPNKIYIKHATTPHWEEFPVKWENSQFVIELQNLNLHNSIYYRSIVVETCLKGLTSKMEHHLMELILNATI